MPNSYIVHTKLYGTGVHTAEDKIEGKIEKRTLEKGTLFLPGHEKLGRPQWVRV